jgi:hypothetical protein
MTEHPNDLLADFIREIEAGWRLLGSELEEGASGRAILASAPATRAALVLAGLERLNALHRSGAAERPPGSVEAGALVGLLYQLLEYPLPLGEEGIAALLRLLAEDLEQFARCREERHYYTAWSVVSTGLQQALSHFHDHGLSPEGAALLARIPPLALAVFPSLDGRKLFASIDEALGAAAPVALVAAKPWGKAALEELAALPQPGREAWEALLLHARTAWLKEPSERWLARAGELVAGVGAAAFEEAVWRWFGLVCAIRNAPLADRNSVTLKGLAWCCAACKRPGVAGALADLAGAGYTRLPRSPVRNAQLGNACILALGHMGSPEAVAQLGRLRSRLKHPGAQAAIARDHAGELAALRPTVAEIEEVLPGSARALKAGWRPAAPGPSPPGGSGCWTRRSWRCSPGA